MASYNIPTLGLLSEAVDLMKANTLLGSITLFRGRRISECFRDSGMTSLEAKAIGKILGDPSISASANLMPPPQDPEIAFIQKRILARA